MKPTMHMMRLVGITALLVVLLISTNALAQQRGYTYSTFTVPLLTKHEEVIWNVWGAGVNNKGMVVGYFYPTRGAQDDLRVYVRDLGRFTLIPAFCSQSQVACYANGINDLNQIVGFEKANREFGIIYSWNEGKKTRLIHPRGYRSTRLLAINNQGVVLGKYSETTSDFGEYFTYDTRTKLFSAVSLPYPSVATGFNSSGVVVGYHSEPQSNRGFIYKDGEFTRIEIPGCAGGDSVFTAISDLGEIVGYCYDGNSNWYSNFFRSASGEVTFFNLPGGAISGAAWGINNSRVISGWYINSAGMFGFRGVPK